jgi:hypothetical protein
MFDNLFKATLGVALLPVAAAADVVTLGGVLTDNNKPFTQECAETIASNLRDAVTKD